MRPDPQQRGFALPLVLATSAVLLLSSLSLQMLASQGQQRSRQALMTAQLRDAERSVVMLFQQQAVGPNACLLLYPSSEWKASVVCPAASRSALQSGLVQDRQWQLLHWQPHGGHGGTLQLLWSDGRQSRLELGWMP
ncbi:hypothetical protein KR52_12975 [Synechococcus sp. KORDI-52]|uniref:hypothetical protein n=1 Tax=Synechococcus sp. KORDI-52 TaxID=585425 RepID=UPI0004E038CF|nr:hypothetical protein [Synechococcus sp. KORDI-52]AII50038.1 hypothetical protein KR52_12975 [Synechococcus sp. KORDI-52]